MSRARRGATLIASKLKRAGFHCCDANGAFLVGSIVAAGCCPASRARSVSRGSGGALPSPAARNGRALAPGSPFLFSGRPQRPRLSSRRASRRAIATAEFQSHQGGLVGLLLPLSLPSRCKVVDGGHCMQVRRLLRSHRVGVVRCGCCTLLPHSPARYCYYWP